MAHPTTIAAGTHVDGSIQASEDIAVEGSVHGTIELSEMLIIAADGVVRGDIQARVAHIEGIVVGTIQATERILLGPTARVQATMTSPLLQMNDGAQFAGELNIGVDGDTPAPTASRATASTTTRRTSSTTATSPTRTTTPSRPTQASTTSRPTSASATPAVVARPTATVTVTVVEEVEMVEETAANQYQDSVVTTIEEESLEQPQQQNETENDDAVTFQELEDDYTVKELREELRRRELPVTGTKSELIERLLEADSQPS